MDDMFMGKGIVRDTGLDTLLLMSTECMVIQEHPAWWVKIEAQEVEPSDGIPHGIRYCLTLHDHHNQRVFGMDNAHAPPKPRHKKYSGRKREWDHIHNSLKDPGSPYEFNDAGQLFVDFWDGVNATLAAHGYKTVDED
jgi:hypothetical protein